MRLGLLQDAARMEPDPARPVHIPIGQRYRLVWPFRVSVL